MDGKNLVILITIMKKGYLRKMRSEGKRLGVKSFLHVLGRGTMNPEMFESLLGLHYDPERDILISVVPREVVHLVKEAYRDIGQMSKKNTGILIQLGVDETAGLVNWLSEDELDERI